ncbi:uncharacterized protein LOC112590644 [Harpegnathos saltator]|uniref:uncharacterized protein LOC112590504 n=1 Tax=Harpegnathos saltator TaxID=610380 RepID=UPI000DBEEBEC|nr:uncharacterized protein LOC112590504 [Harpegnathos saltator]XP_025163605.1 uncharacterized protein LOC112590644 [Harpegnathos saltator]
MNNCAIILPNDDNKWLSFTNYCRKERIPFIIYADLECILEKTPREEQTSSYAYQHHSVFSIAYYVRCSYDESLSAYRCRRDRDCISWFVKELEELAHRVKDILSANVLMETLSKE